MSVKIIVFVCLGKVFLSHQTYKDTQTTVLYRWKTVDFNYPTEEARNRAMSQGEFIPSNVLLLDSDVHVDGITERHFVTTPKFRTGIPATLSRVIRIRGQDVLEPFPRWPDKNDLCRGPFSVFRTYIDKCGLMWALDSGRGPSYFSKSSSETNNCPPKLLVYDLNHKDREILRYEFPQKVLRNQSLLITIVTESYRSDCADSIAYIADVHEPGLIVFDYREKRSWRIENKLFDPDPSQATTTSNGVTFILADGIFGLALGSAFERPRKLYFHSYASVRESWVPVNVLKNPKIQNSMVQKTVFVESPGTRAGQSTVEVMTKDGILLYPLIPTNEIACWNSRVPFINTTQHVLKRDDENFQFISGMKLMKNNTLIITSCRFPNYKVGKSDNNMDYKYRMIVIKDVRRLLQNTPCAGERMQGGLL